MPVKDFFPSIGLVGLTGSSTQHSPYQDEEEGEASLVTVQEAVTMAVRHAFNRQEATVNPCTGASAIRRASGYPVLKGTLHSRAVLIIWATLENYKVQTCPGTFKFQMSKLKKKSVIVNAGCQFDWIWNQLREKKPLGISMRGGPSWKDWQRRDSPPYRASSTFIKYKEV